VLAEQQIKHLATAMNRDGYAILHDYIECDKLREMKKFVHDMHNLHKEYFSMEESDLPADSVLDKFRRSSSLLRILNSLYAEVTNATAATADVHCTLRVLYGKTGLRRSFQYHYDAYLVTAVVPIVIPSVPYEARGELIIYPNIRKIRSNSIINMIEKAIFQNPLVRRVMAAGIVRQFFKAQVIQMQPGNIYFFWGYQSLHANLPCHPRSLRATAIFHFGNPHEASAPLQFVKNYRRHLETSIRHNSATRTKSGMG
jgi:hypothetical protein